ncbi:TRAP transporter small permease [Paenalcaligenes sp. Me52]|uniref:TRAP transporter small permease n=1 Tax=Paenalcaligenes sp. Me52 TaxID=3392038 RepID=UPI003D271B5A
MFLKSLTHWINKGLELFLVVCLAIMAILVFANVVLRYGFDSGIAVSEELARLLFVWLIFLGAVLATRQHAHIAFNSFLAKRTPTCRKILIAISSLLMLVGGVIFVIGGWKQTLINMDNSYPVLGISYAWLYGTAIVFGVGLVLSTILNMWESITSPTGFPGGDE